MESIMVAAGREEKRVVLWTMIDFFDSKHAGIDATL
jgi:hypothetical protein